MSSVEWINPETELPQQKQTVLFKTVVLHTKKIRYGRFIDGEFQDLESPSIVIDAKDVWGWVAFQDSDKRK